MRWQAPSRAVTTVNSSSRKLEDEELLNPFGDPRPSHVGFEDIERHFLCGSIPFIAAF